MHKKLDDFDWGVLETDELKDILIREMIDGNLYSRFFDVREGDVVVDVGASVGPFSYFISNNKPLQIYTFEPSKKEFPTLCKNMLGLPSCNINKAIWDGDGITNSIDSDIYFWDGYIETIKFKTFLNLYNVKKIDFLKTDCEGGEYHIINDENIEFILENVGVIAGEWHLETAEKKEKFRKFRDYYLPMFKSYEVYSVDGVNIKWDLHNEHFLHYYKQVIVYIDNRK